MNEMITQNVKVFDETAKLGYLKFRPFEVDYQENEDDELQFLSAEPEWLTDEDGNEFCCVARCLFNFDKQFVLEFEKDKASNDIKVILRFQQIDDSDNLIFESGCEFARFQHTKETSTPENYLVSLFRGKGGGEAILSAANQLLSEMPCTYEHMNDENTDAYLQSSDELDDIVLARLTTPFGFIEVKLDYDDLGDSENEENVIYVEGEISEGYDFAVDIDASEIEDTVKTLISTHQWNTLYDVLRTKFIENLNTVYSVKKGDWRYNRAVFEDADDCPIVPEALISNKQKPIQHKATKKKYKPKKKSKKRHK